MLRECMEREVLAKILLDDDRFFQMFEFIVLDSFDISSDAHRTFRVSKNFQSDDHGNDVVSQKSHQSREADRAVLECIHHTLNEA